MQMPNVFSIVIASAVIVLAVALMLHLLDLPANCSNADDEQGQIHLVKNKENDRILRLNQEIALLQSKVDQLEQAIRQTQTALHSLQPRSETVSVNNADDRFKPFERADMRQRALQQQMQQEEIDETWERQIQKQLETSISKLAAFGLGDTHLIYAECRTTLCFAEFKLDPQDNPRFLTTALSMPTINRMTVFPATADDGTALSRVYLYRE